MTRTFENTTESQPGSLDARQFVQDLLGEGVSESTILTLMDTFGISRRLTAAINFRKPPGDFDKEVPRDKVIFALEVAISFLDTTVSHESRHGYGEAIHAINYYQAQADVKALTRLKLKYLGESIPESLRGEATS